MKDATTKFNEDLTVLFNEIEKTKPTRTGTIEGMINYLKWLQEKLHKLNDNSKKLISDYSHGDQKTIDHLHAIAVDRINVFLESYRIK
jgi:hypothetical protein